jgi:hypothetical protein
MPSAAANRNLLFGILALQMDFIGRDALIAGMNAWVLGRPLGTSFAKETFCHDPIRFCVRHWHEPAVIAGAG